MKMIWSSRVKAKTTKTSRCKALVMGVSPMYLSIKTPVAGT